MSKYDLIEVILENTRPLLRERGKRLPLYVWYAQDPGAAGEKELESIIRKLEKRGIALVSSWNHGRRDESLEASIKIASIQKRLGLTISINANSLLHRFYDGDPSTAHLSEKGETFFDKSFAENVNIGCPFAVNHRYGKIKERFEWFAREFRKKNLSVDFVFADWEIDGLINTGRSAAFTVGKMVPQMIFVQPFQFLNHTFL